jgi:2-oxoisovalerate dehydrogenase E2 component (dihydrolipoyl transacylase)
MMLRAPKLRALRRGTSIVRSAPRAAIPLLSDITIRCYRASAPSEGKVAFKLADVGEGIAEVEVIQWYVQEGDAVKQFDKICEVQSDKATLDITSRFDGVVDSLEYGVGDMAQTGTPLLFLEVEGDADANTTDKRDPPPNPTPAAETAPPPPLPPSESLQRADSSELPYNTPAVSEPRAVDANGKVLATPAVRRLSREHGIDLARVLGTGKAGRITKSDVFDFMNGAQEGQRSGESQRSSPPPIGEAGGTLTDSPGTLSAPVRVLVPLREDETVPIRGMQRAMVQTMKRALEIPHFGYCDEFEMGALREMRGQLQRSVGDARGVKITYMPLLLKAASLALTQHPGLNASVSSDEESVTKHAAHNIGFAMDSPSGLVVPVVSHVEQRSILEIAEEMSRIIALGQANRLGPSELSGGTFTLSNIGSIGGTYASPVILPPQVAIGAMGKVQRLPRFDEEGDVFAAEVMNVSWSADHRVVDGATMARFSNQMKMHVENPVTMLADLK